MRRGRLLRSLKELRDGCLERSVGFGRLGRVFEVVVFGLGRGFGGRGCGAAFAGGGCGGLFGFGGASGGLCGPSWRHGRRRISLKGLSGEVLTMRLGSFGGGDAILR